MKKERAIQTVRDFVSWFNGKDLLHAIENGHACFVHRRVKKLERAVRVLRKRSRIAV